MESFYVYIFLRPDKPGVYDYGDNLKFEFEPFYVGKGHADRISNSKTIDNKSRSFKFNILEKLKKQGLTVISFKIKENMTENEALEYEKYVILKIGRLVGNLNYPTQLVGPLTNLTDGGDGICKRPVLQYDLNGNFVKEFISVSDATYITKISNIIRTCNNRSATSGQFIWKYKTNDIIEHKIDITHLKKLRHTGKPTERPVNQYDINNNFIESFDSIKQAQLKTGCNKSKIVMVCQGLRKHTKNNIWKYADLDAK